MPSTIFCGWRRAARRHKKGRRLSLPCSGKGGKRKTASTSPYRARPSASALIGGPERWPRRFGRLGSDISGRALAGGRDWAGSGRIACIGQIALGGHAFTLVEEARTLQAALQRLRGIFRRGPAIGGLGMTAEARYIEARGDCGHRTVGRDRFRTTRRHWRRGISCRSWRHRRGGRFDRPRHRIGRIDCVFALTTTAAQRKRSAREQQGGRAGSARDRQNVARRIGLRGRGGALHCSWGRERLGRICGSCDGRRGLDSNRAGSNRGSHGRCGRGGACRSCSARSSGFGAHGYWRGLRGCRLFDRSTGGAEVDRYRGRRVAGRRRRGRGDRGDSRRGCDDRRRCENSRCGRGHIGGLRKQRGGRQGEDSGNRGQAGAELGSCIPHEQPTAIGCNPLHAFGIRRSMAAMKGRCRRYSCCYAEAVILISSLY